LRFGLVRSIDHRWRFILRRAVVSLWLIHEFWHEDKDHESTKTRKGEEAAASAWRLTTTENRRACALPLTMRTFASA